MLEYTNLTCYSKQFSQYCPVLQPKVNHVHISINSHVDIICQFTIKTFGMGMSENPTFPFPSSLFPFPFPSKYQTLFPFPWVPWDPSYSHSHAHLCLKYGAVECCRYDDFEESMRKVLSQLTSASIPVTRQASNSTVVY